MRNVSPEMTWQKEMQAKQRQETISRTGFKLKAPVRISWVFYVAMLRQARVKELF